VGRVPRGRLFTAARPVVVAEHRTFVITTLGSVLASHVLVAGERSSIALRAREDVVRVRGIAMPLPSWSQPSVSALA